MRRRDEGFDSRGPLALLAGAVSLAALVGVVHGVSAQEVPAAARSGGAGAATFTTEAQLRDAAEAAAIESFWGERGEQGAFTGEGGLRIAYVRFLQPEPARERGAIVLVSGRTESMLKYKELVRDLWRAGYAVYTHDHRGQGLSQREPQVAEHPQMGHVGRFDDYVADLSRFFTEQVMPGRHGRVFVLAHSMGGAVAARWLESGRAEVQQVRAAVLSSPMLMIQGIAGASADIVSCRAAAWMASRGFEDAYVVRGRDYAPPPFEENLYTGSAVRYERLLEQVRQAPDIRLGSPTHGWLAQACEATRLARADAGRVRTPTLVLLAGDDEIVHASGAQDFCRRLSPGGARSACGGPQGGPVVIAGARHELLIEKDPLRSEVLRRALSFFEASVGM